MKLAQLPPLSLYVHIPWCLRKCPYCDFNSHEQQGELPEAAYVDALVADLESTLPQVWGRKLHSIFVGGGTPSLFCAGAIETLLTAIRTRIPLEPDAEVTMEANPGTFEAGKFAGFRDAGVTRLSLGVQSFDDARLQAVGRVHDAAEARRALEHALATFPTVNVDLMYALPGQSLEGALSDVRVAIASGAPHVSAYHLTLEPDTHFARFPPPLPDDELSADMQEAIEATLAGAGFDHYETSAFGRPGHRGRHNLNYWRFGDYLGIGAGAHAKVSFRERIVREVRERKPVTYLRAALAGEARMESRDVAEAELPFEFMLNALRLVDGFAPGLFELRTGLSLAVIEPQLAEAEALGLVTRDLEAIRPTLRGQRFLNALLEKFLVARPRPARVINIYSRDSGRRPA